MDLYTSGWPKWRKVAYSASMDFDSTPVSLPMNSPDESESMKDMLVPPPVALLAEPSAKRLSKEDSSSAMACRRALAIVSLPGGAPRREAWRQCSMR